MYKSGYSRSQNAEIAEYRGRLPLTRGIAAMREKYRCSIQQATEALLATWNGEWHHVSPAAKKVKYYDLNKAGEYLLKEYPEYNT